MKILVATHNSKKAKEITALFSDLCGIEVLTLSDVGYEDDIIEDGQTFEENALIKARAAAALGYIGVADDSGLCVDCLGGAPGIYSARFAGEPCDNEKNNEKLLTELSGVSDAERGAKFVSVIACVLPGGAEYTVRGECAGKILREYRGTAGFGYDPLFLYEPLGKTFAELSPEEKNTISHRAESMRKFATLFREKILKELD